MGGGCGLPEGIGGLRGNKGVVPLSVEAEEFSLKTGLKDRVPTGEESDGSENGVPSRESPECSCGVDHSHSRGRVPDCVCWGGSPGRPGSDVQAVAEMEFSAVAEVYSSAVDAEGVPSVIQDSGRRRDVVGACPVGKLGTWWTTGLFRNR